MDIQEYVDEKRQLENNILEYLDHKSINDIGQLKETLVKQKIFDDENEFRSFLHLIECISENYHRTKYFFDKIDSILSLFKTEFQKYLTNSEIFNILNCKRILLFLFENKILNFDYYVIDKLKPSIPYFYNFLNDMKPFLDDEQLSQIQDKLTDMSLDDFKQNQKNGENEKLICYYMRNDMVEDFIRLINQTNLSLETTIDKSIFETNAFLIDKEPTLIEYATFFGSLQIVKYLQLNNIELTSSLWMYAIHGQNAEIIHLLEENHVQPEDKTYKKVLLEAINCNNNELVDYIMNNYIENLDESVYNESFQSYNYSYFPKNVFTQYYFNQLCVFGYYYIVSLMIEKYKFDVNFEVQIIYDDCSFVLTPLLSAITYDHYNIAILILQYTNDGINFKSSKNLFHKYFYKCNSISHAISNNNTKILNVLLSQNKISVNDEQYSYGFIDGQEKAIKFIPLVEAVENKQYEIIKLLLSHPKIDVNLRDEKSFENLITKCTALFSATQNDNIRIIELLLSNNNININKSSILQSSNFEWKITCLFTAVNNQNTEIIKLFVANPKIDVNKLSKKKIDDTEYNMTPLYLSVFDDTIEIAKILLSNSKINVNKESTVKTKKLEIIETPLNLAIKHQNKEIIELLLKYPKIDVDKIAITSEKKFLSKTINKEHILHTAIKTGNAEIVNLILNQPNIDINCKSISEKILNIYDDDPEIEIEQNSALHLAIFEENEDLVSLLISNDKIKINQKGINFYNGMKFEWTSLTMAIDRNQFDICQKLLSHPDIDVNSIIKVTNKESTTINKSALFLAVENGYEDIVDILLLHSNIDVNAKEILKDNTQIKETFLLHKAFEKGNTNIIKSLLNCQNIDLNVKSVKSVILKDSIEVEYKTTMIYAIELSNVEIVQILLSKENLDLNSRSTKFHSTDHNFNEENDLLKAALNNKEILKILLDHIFAKNKQLIPKDMKAYLSMTNDEEIKEIIFNANKKSEYQQE